MISQAIWITGATGRLGKELTERLSQNREYKIIATDLDVDVTDAVAVNQYAEMYKPTVIINCASLSDAKYCEEHMVEAYKVNALGARNLAIASRKVNAKIIHMSTDDVFDGMNTGTFTEFDTPNPVSVYGKSKFAGENYVRELNSKHIIVRSSWVYGFGGNDFFSYVVEKGENNKQFRAPWDTVSTPTSAKELAKFIELLIDSSEYGIFHASCEGVCSRHEFAKTILKMMGYNYTIVQGNYSVDKKGTSTLLENLMMKMTGIYDMPEWTVCLKEYIDSIKK